MLGLCFARGIIKLVTVAHVQGPLSPMEVKSQQFMLTNDQPYIACVPGPFPPRSKGKYLRSRHLHPGSEVDQTQLL